MVDLGCYKWYRSRRCANEDVGPPRGVDCEIPHRLVGESNEAFFIRVWKPLPSRRVLKLRGKSLKRTISASGGLGLLQMVLEPDTGWCTNDGVGPPKGVDCEIPHRLERRTKHSL